MFCVDDTAPVEPRAGHPDRRADAILLVDDEILGQHVQDFPAGGKRHRLRRVNRTPHVVAGDLAVLAGDGNDTAAVEPFDVRPRQREVDRVDLDAGHQLGLLDRLLDRIHRAFEIDDDAAFDAARFRCTDPDDVDAAIVQGLADDADDRGRADIESNDISLFARH